MASVSIEHKSSYQLSGDGNKNNRFSNKQGGGGGGGELESAFDSLTLQSYVNNGSSSISKMKRSVSFRRNIVKKLPVIKKEFGCRFTALSKVKKTSSSTSTSSSSNSSTFCGSDDNEEEEDENESSTIVERLIESVVTCNSVALDELITKNNVDVNTTYQSWSLLHFACSMVDQTYFGSDEHIECVKLLLNRGSHINATDKEGWTPLHLACQLGITRLISYLVKKGADSESMTSDEHLRPIDLVESDNYVALSFLMSSASADDDSENANDI